MLVSVMLIKKNMYGRLKLDFFKISAFENFTVVTGSTTSEFFER